MASICDRSFDRVAANSETRTHRNPDVQTRITGSAHQQALTLARRETWFAEQ
jgi:hypothetical protein